MKRYRKELKDVLNMEHVESSKLRFFYAKNHLFEEDVIAFEPHFGMAEDGMLFELKKDLYRIAHLFIERLFLYECENLSEEESLNGTFAKIDWLLKENKICPDGAKNLKEMFAKVLQARLKAYFRTNSAKSVEDPVSSLIMEIDEKTCNIYHLLCQGIKEHFKPQKPIQANVFYSEDPFLAAQIKVRFGKPLDAKQHLITHLKAHPSHVDGLILLSHIDSALGYEEASLWSLDKATSIVKALSLEQRESKAVYSSNFGLFYLARGELVKGTALIEEAWELIKNNPRLVNLRTQISDNLAMSYLRRMEFKKAQEVSERLLKNLKAQQGKSSIRHFDQAMAHCLRNLSLAHHLQKDTANSIKYAEESLAIFYKIYGRSHSAIGSMLTALGNQYYTGGSYEKGIGYLQEGLDVTVAVLGEFHQTSIQKYLHLSHLLNRTDVRKGVVSADYLEMAEKVETIQLSFLYDIAQSWERIGKWQEAEKVLLKAVQISTEQKSLIDVATSYHHLANLCAASGKNVEALSYAKLVMEELQKISESRPIGFMIATLINLARFKMSQIVDPQTPSFKEHKKIILEHLQKAEQLSLEMNKTTSEMELLSSIHSLMGSYEWTFNKDLKKTAEYYLKSLNELEEVFGLESPNLLKGILMLAVVYARIPDKKGESRLYFKRLLYLAEKHFGKSSPEYATALQYINKVDNLELYLVNKEVK